MDYLPYQRIVKEADDVCADWESLRGIVQKVVHHRLTREHDAAERLLGFEMPRKLASLADRYSAPECESRIEALFREEYSLAAASRLWNTTRTQAAPVEAAAGKPQVAENAPIVEPAARRSYREPQENDIASMIDDMLSGQYA